MAPWLPVPLNYEWAIGSDHATCHLCERYQDSASAMKHLGTFMKEYAGRFIGCVEPKRTVVYGNPDEGARKALQGFGAVFMQHFGGFAR